MPVGVSPRMEDYLEAVLLLEEEKRVARVTEIAESLDVTKSTVTSALRKLAGSGLVEHHSYRYVRLTDKGRAVAKGVRKDHRLLKAFFTRVLGVNPDRAVRDACTAEHHISGQTLERLTRFIEFIDRCPRSGQAWLDHFHGYCEGAVGGSASEPICGRKCLQECREDLKTISTDHCKTRS